MSKHKLLLKIFFAALLFVIGSLYVKQGIKLAGEAEIMASQIDSAKLHFKLGFNSAAEWKDDYLAGAYIRLGGGCLMLVTGLYLLFSQGGRAAARRSEQESDHGSENSD